MFFMTSYCGASSHFIDSPLVGDIESRIKDIVKLDPPATIVAAVHNALSRVSMGTLTIRFIYAQGFLHDMLLPAMNLLGRDRDLFPGKTVALNGVNTIIANESNFDVGKFKISLRADTDCPTIYYLHLELAPRGNYQTEAAFSKRVISGHTIPMRSALVSRLLRSEAMGVVVPLKIVARLFIAAPTAVRGLPALRSTAPAHGARLISGGVMGVVSALTVTTPFAASTPMAGLQTTVATTATAMRTSIMAVARSKHREPAPGTSEPAHHAGRAGHRRDGSQFQRLADHGGHFQDQ